MTEKELLSQLNNLKSIKPENTWKMENRDILLSQISGGYHYAEKTELKKENFVFSLKHLFAQPAFITITILVFVLGGGVLSLNASRDTKPGDSLYIAKIISEKARVTFAFNEEDKAKLGIEFAGNRAKEINQVLASESNKEDKAEKIEKLAANLRKEISAVKIRVKDISSGGSASGAAEEGGAEEKDDRLFSANLGRENNGVQVYEQKESGGGGETAPATNSIATSSRRGDEGGTENNIEQVLNEAERLLQNKDYSSTLNKLAEVDEMVNQIGNSGGGMNDNEGEATATSTE